MALEYQGTVTSWRAYRTVSALVRCNSNPLWKFRLGLILLVALKCQDRPLFQTGAIPPFPTTLRERPLCHNDTHSPALIIALHATERMTGAS